MSTISPRTARTGFTIVEIIAVIAITVLLMGIVAVSFRSLNERSVLDGAVNESLSALADARSSTLASIGGSQYGVHFETNSVTIFTGASYVPGAAANRTTTLSPLVEISGITLAGGGSDVIFERLTGATTQSGTITLRLTGDVSQTRVIRIEPSGIAFEQ